VCRFALAAEKQPSELLFEKFDGARQRRLRHVAPIARAREIQFLGNCEEVTNLVHLHRFTTLALGLQLAEGQL